MKKEGPYLAEHLVDFPVTFVYDVKAEDKGFSLHVAKVRFLGISLPRFMQPLLAAGAGEWRGRYRFSTWVGFCFCGRVISYFSYLDLSLSIKTYFYDRGNLFQYSTNRLQAVYLSGISDVYFR